MMEKEDKKINEEELLEHGMFYLINEKYDKAIEEFDRVIKINPGNAEAYYNIGLAFESKNMPEKAKEMYKKALEKNPKHKLSREHLEKLIGI